jgi:hypothetical protein
MIPTRKRIAMVMLGKKPLPRLLPAPASFPRLTWVVYDDTQPQSSQSLPQAGAVKDTICYDMADMLTRIYYPHFSEQQRTNERNRLCHAAIEWLDTANARRNLQWKDYIDGIALSLNPLPSSPASTFHVSDLEALQSDWLNVRADLSAIWSILSTVHHSLEHTPNDEQSGRQHEPAEPFGVGGTGPRKTIPFDRDHTPST